MLRSHRLAYELDMRHKLRVSRYAGDVRWYMVSLRGSFLLGSAVVGVGGRGPDGD